MKEYFITRYLHISDMLLITNKGQAKFRDSVTTIPVGILYKYKTLNGINILISWKGKVNGTQWETAWM